MSKNVLDLRFGVRRTDGYQSTIWRLWITRECDVYLAHRALARIAKYSFHKSGICRSAFTAEHGTPPTMNDRAIHKWRRAPTPPVGSGRAVRIAWLAFPTDFLSKPSSDDKKKMLWIDAAPSSGATYVELSFVAESESSVQQAFVDAGQRKLLCFQKLPNGENFLLAYYHSDWENKDLTVPGEGKVADLLFSVNDPQNTGRPVRICFGPIPNDGDAVSIQELGGYAISH